MVIGILPNSSSIETLLNNLKEADFDLKNVSVIMADQKARNAVARDTGPFKGIRPDKLPARLAQAGLSAQDVSAIAAAVTKGQVLVAIATAQGTEKAAGEMLRDYDPLLVKVV